VSQSRNRDAAVDRWLRRQPASVAKLSATEACIDPELLAAWADGGLGAEARVSVEEHLSSCARCQAIAGTMARTESIAEWATLERRSPRKWLTWAVPLTAAATIAMLIVMDRRTQRAVPPSRTDAPQVAESRRGDPPVIAPAERGDLKDQSTSATSRDRQARTAAPTDARQSSDAVAKRENDKLQANRPADPTSMQSRSTPPAAQPPAAVPQTLKPPEQKAAAAQARAEESDRFMRKLDAPMIEIRSPNPSVRWRAAGMTVERSIDSGTTWTPAPTGLTTAITAGAAPGGSTCWLAGRGGLVLLSIDGATWQRVSSPTTTDLSAIRATDARNAAVTTADGAEFTTNDGGRSWVRRDLQENPTAPF
jgi:Putative zinc-finger